MLKDFHLSSETQRPELVDIINSVPLGHVVHIRPKDGIRSASANRLYWWIVEQLSEYSGHSKGEMHDNLKKEHLTPILLARDTLYQREYLRAVALERKGQAEEAAMVMQENNNNNLSTKKISSKLFAEYLDQVKFQAGLLGIVLPTAREFEGK